MIDSEWVDLFHAMNIAVATRRPDGTVVPLARQPSWFELQVLTSETSQTSSDRLGEFLQAFLVEAHEFWDAGKPGCLKSGPWIKEDPGQEEVIYEATAVTTQDRHLLLVERNSRGWRDQQAIIQKARELALSHHHVERERLELSASKVALEESVREKNALLGALFEASPLPLVMVDTTYRVRMWNPAAEKLFGWSAAEVLGSTLPMVSPEWVVESRSILSDIFEGEAITGLEVERRTRDGRTLHLRLNGAALLDSEGAPAAAVAVYEDITEKKLAEARLQHVQKLDAMGRLAGGIAHDFNNLLTVIRGEMELALGEEYLPDSIRESLTNVQNTADRGAALTRQLLMFARRQPGASDVMEIDVVVTDLERMLRRLIDDRIKLSLDLRAGAARVNVDRGQLEQVLTNLVVNARDAISGTGEITISTAAERVAPRQPRPGLDAGEWVVISVTDTGVGVPEVLRTRIFEPFFSTKDPEEGTGLGLTTSHGIVQAMGGVLSLDSRTGVGSTFHVHLPRVFQRSTEEEPETGRTETTGRELILIVEDQPELLNVARRMLIRQGYTVHAAVDEADAWRVVEEIDRPPDLLVTDLQLPMGDGLNLIREFRSRYPNLGALLTSGSAHSDSLALEGIPFLPKPYTLASLSEAVRAVLDDRVQPTSHRSA